MLQNRIIQNVVKQDYSYVIGQDYSNVREQDYSNVREQDYSNVIERNYSIVTKQDYPKCCRTGLSKMLQNRIIQNVVEQNYPKCFITELFKMLQNSVAFGLSKCYRTAQRLDYQNVIEQLSVWIIDNLNNHITFTQSRYVINCAIYYMSYTNSVPQHLNISSR